MHEGIDYIEGDKIIPRNGHILPELPSLEEWMHSVGAEIRARKFCKIYGTLRVEFDIVGYFTGWEGRATDFMKVID